MNFSLPSPLPRCDRLLLRVAVRMVPPAERLEWLHCWQAELWHRRHPRSGCARPAADLYPGLVRDAIWLRTDGWQRALSGSALLCVLLLGAALTGVSLPLLQYLGGWRALSAFVAGEFSRFVCEAALVTLVSFATSSRFVEYHAEPERAARLRARSFLAIKLVLVQASAFLASNDLTQPFHTTHPILAEIAQSQVFVLLALLALRWSFEDQDSRCKHCLRSLAAPARVGRPSWNFLDSNGTELVCREGHGLLNVPEMETSWRRSRRWIAA